MESSSSSSSTPSEVNYGEKLKLAADSGDFAEIKKLIEKDKVDINLADLYGDTCLHAAVQKGRLQIVNYLLSHDADPNVRNKAGSTPLHKVIGTKIDQLEILRALLKKGADPNIKNTAGLLPEQMTTWPLLLEILQGADAVEEKIVVPKALHGRVIGRKGVVLNEIRDETNCSIQLPPADDRSNEITIRGRKENVEKAKQLILDVVKKDELDPNQEYTSVQLPIAKDKLKFIIGKEGRKIEELRREFEVEITIPKDGDLDGMVLVRGKNADNVDQATRKIFFIVQNPPPKPFKPRTAAGGSSGSGSASTKQNGKGGGFQKSGAGGSKHQGSKMDGQKKGDGSNKGGGGKGKAKETQS